MKHNIKQIMVAFERKRYIKTFIIPRKTNRRQGCLAKILAPTNNRKEEQKKNGNCFEFISVPSSL